MRCLFVKASDVSGDAFPPSNIPCMEGGVQSDEEEEKRRPCSRPLFGKLGTMFWMFCNSFW